MITTPKYLNHMKRTLGMCYVRSRMPRLHRHEWVNVHWHVPIRPNSLFPLELTPEGKPRRARLTAELERMFTPDEALQLVGYLQGCGHTDIHTERLPRPAPLLRAAIRLEEQFSYTLPFRVWGQAEVSDPVDTIADVTLSARKFPNRRWCHCHFSGERFQFCESYVWHIADEPHRTVSYATAEKLTYTWAPHRGQMGRGFRYWKFQLPDDKR